MTSEWRHYKVSQEIKGFERGWRGLWKHFKDVFFHREPTLVPYKVEISYFAKSEEPIKVGAVQLELRSDDQNSKLRP
jgi:hypothetical protein